MVVFGRRPSCCVLHLCLVVVDRVIFDAVRALRDGRGALVLRMNRTPVHSTLVLRVEGPAVIGVNDELGPVVVLLLGQRGAEATLVQRSGPLVSNFFLL